jgi:hypothetical protein
MKFAAAGRLDRADPAVGRRSAPAISGHSLAGALAVALARPGRHCIRTLNVSWSLCRRVQAKSIAEHTSAPARSSQEPWRGHTRG